MPIAESLTMNSVGDVLSEDFKITIYAKDVDYYLCFAQGKLVGKVSSGISICLDKIPKNFRYEIMINLAI